MLNKAILIGRLVADPELRTTPNGVSVTTFRIAIDRPYSGKNSERQTDFLPIVAWRNTADFVAKYFKKGSDICIEGSIRPREYEGKDGSKRYITEIYADNVTFVGRKNQSNSGSYDDFPPVPEEFGGAPAPKKPTPAPSYSSGSADDFQMVPSDEDDLPF